MITKLGCCAQFGAICVWWLDMNNKNNKYHLHWNYENTRATVSLIQISDNLILLLPDLQSTYHINPTTSQFQNKIKNIEITFRKDVKKLYEILQPENSTNPFYVRSIVILFMFAVL